MAPASEGLVSRHVNRRISRPVARLLARTAITPNQISAASFVLALVSFGLFLVGHNLWAGLAAQASSVMDGVDGDLARMKSMTTRFGGFFDSVLDRYADVAILAGMALWSVNYEAVSGWQPWAFGLLAIVGSLMISYSRARAEASFGATFTGPAGFLASRDARLLLIMVGAILGQALATLALLALLTNGVVLWRLVLARGETACKDAASGGVQRSETPPNRLDYSDEAEALRETHNWL